LNFKRAINVLVERNHQTETRGGLSEIVGFKVSDNGVGFTDQNRESFDTLYSDQKINQGGKGFGRFTCLKYFEDLKVDSVYFDGVHKHRQFSMGKDKDIIVNELVEDSDSKVVGSIVYLRQVKRKFPEKKLVTIARSLVEILLPYFITKGFVCPKITLMEMDKSNPIVLNDYVGSDSAVIQETLVDNGQFQLGIPSKLQNFEVRIFKFYSPKANMSKISLVADKREVTESPIYLYIPEFSEEFYDKSNDGKDNTERNYIIKTYVFSPYLNSHVSLERGDFTFQKDNDMFHGISQTDIETRASEITKEAIIDEISLRQNKKQARINTYIEERAPWHRELIKEIDLSNFPYNPSDEVIETKLQKEKFVREVKMRNEVKSILKDENVDDAMARVPKIVAKISSSSKNDLLHYVALRRSVLDLFERSLEINMAGKHESEGFVHDIIFPMREDSDSVKYSDHNLWIIDERLNFTSNSR